MIQEFFVDKYEAQAFHPSGDEFIILLQNKFLNNFKETSDLFKACFVQSDERSFSVGVSFGYAVNDGPRSTGRSATSVGA